MLHDQSVRTNTSQQGKMITRLWVEQMPDND